MKIENNFMYLILMSLLISTIFSIKSVLFNYSWALGKQRLQGTLILMGIIFIVCSFPTFKNSHDLKNILSILHLLYIIHSETLALLHKKWSIRMILVFFFFSLFFFSIVLPVAFINKCIHSKLRIKSSLQFNLSQLTCLKIKRHWLMST